MEKEKEESNGMAYKRMKSWGACVMRSFEHLTLGSGSSCDLRVMRSSPLWALPPSPFAPPSSLSLPLK